MLTADLVCDFFIGANRVITSKEVLAQATSPDSASLWALESKVA